MTREDRAIIGLCFFAIVVTAVVMVGTVTIGKWLLQLAGWW